MMLEAISKSPMHATEPQKGAETQKLVVGISSVTLWSSVVSSESSMLHDTSLEP